jgi:RND family efflux transporter MFP subunit
MTPPPTDPIRLPPPALLPPARRRLSPAARLRAVLGPALGIAVLCGVGYVAVTWRSDPDAAGVLDAAAARGELTVSVTDRGELESAESTDVRCELEGGGKITSIVAEGTAVKKGDEMCKLDTDAVTKTLNEQEVKYEQAEGKLKAAKSELIQAKAKEASEVAKAKLALDLAAIDLEAYQDKDGEYKKELEKLKGAEELAKKKMDEAKADLEFSRKMVRDGLAPIDQVRLKEGFLRSEEYVYQGAVAERTVLERFTHRKKTTELKAKAEDAARELERVKESQKSAVEKAEGELKSASRTAEIEKKQLDRMRQQIERCTIKAPSDGIVIYNRRNYWDENSRVRPGAQVYFQQPIITLPNLSKMRVKLKVHESVVKKVKAGLPATMTLDALPNRTLHGTVTTVATLAESNPWRDGGVKQYDVQVSIDDLPADAGLKPGMTAEVKVLVGKTADGVMVPIQAVAEYDGEPVVYVVSGRSIRRRAVTPGDSNDQLMQVTDGLAEGERVALDARVRAAAELKAAPPKVPGAEAKDAPKPAADGGSAGQRG